MKKFLAILIILIGTIPIAAAKTTEWQNVEKGIDYTKIQPWPEQPKGMIHAFKIDLNQWQLDLAFTKDYPDQLATVTSLADHSNALIAINGGFFSPNSEPMGLRIKNGEVINSIRPISWWAIFYLENNRPHIQSFSAFKMNPAITLALQSGPRLLIRGLIPKLKQDRANRSAICITTSQEVILLASEYLEMTTSELASLISQSSEDNGLDCYDALNLDGGSSTSLYANLNNFSLNIPSLVSISDAVVVKPK